jgi:hypothetical protein
MSGVGEMTDSGGGIADTGGFRVGLCSKAFELER